MTIPRWASLPGRLVAAALGSAVLLASPRAGAFCRGLTFAGPDPATTGMCFDGGGAPAAAYELYWKSLCVGYSLQKDASTQVTLAQATQVAAQAFGAWSQAGCPAGGHP